MANSQYFPVNPWLGTYVTTNSRVTTTAPQGIYEFPSGPIDPSSFDLPNILAPLNRPWETKEDAVNQIVECLSYLTSIYRTDNLYKEIASAIISFLQKEMELKEPLSEVSKIKEMPKELSKSRTLDFKGFENSESDPDETP